MLLKDMVSLFSQNAYVKIPIFYYINKLFKDTISGKSYINGIFL